MSNVTELFKAARAIATMFADAQAVKMVHLEVAACFFRIADAVGPSTAADPGLPGGALLVALSDRVAPLPLDTESQAFLSDAGTLACSLPADQIAHDESALAWLPRALRQWLQARDAQGCLPLCAANATDFASELCKALQAMFPDEATTGPGEADAVEAWLWEELNGMARDVTPTSTSKPTSTSTCQPASRSMPAHARWLGELDRILASELLHQASARERLVQTLALHAVGGGTPDMPPMLLLAGAPASGKSHLVDLLKRSLGGTRAFLQLNMASFQNEREGFGLTGLRAGWSDPCNGRLTGFVEQNPDAVIVFDHIDRAHPRVQHLLADLFLRGALDDEFGFGGAPERGRPDRRSVCFKRTLLIFTTQLGESAWQRAGVDEELARDPERALARLRAAVAAGSTRPGALAAPGAEPLATALSGITLLPFTPLPLDTLVDIAQRSLSTLPQRLPALRFEGLESPDLAWALTLACGPEIDVHSLRSTVVRQVLQPWMSHAGGALALSQGQGTIERVVIDLAGHEGLRRLRDEPGDLLRRLMRRGERLDLAISSRQDRDTLVVRVDVRALVRVPQQADHGLDGGLAVELPQVRLADIVGHETVKQRLREVLALLSAPAHASAPIPSAGSVMRNMSAIARTAPRGMLLHGAPGNGKTLLAKALAAEAELPVIAVSGTQLLDVALVRQVFARARRYAPSLVFIDEIDALGRRGDAGHDACINQLLVEIDGFVEASHGGVFVVAATNHPQRVDPALLRAGRLELHVEILPPDAPARRHFLARLRANGTRGPWNERRLIQRSAGLSGADMERLLRECVQASDRSGVPTRQADVLEGIDCLKHGARRRERLPERTRVRTAWHEAGHAVVSHVLMPESAIEQVTIAPRAGAAGFVSFLEAGPTISLNRLDVEHRLCVALAGRLAERCCPESARAAEEGDDTGAASDLRGATSLAWKAVTEWGMDEDFGWLTLAEIPQHAQGALAARAQQRTLHWVAQARACTQALVLRHRDAIERVARRLLRDDTVPGHQVPALVRGRAARVTPAPASATRAPASNF